MTTEEQTVEQTVEPKVFRDCARRYIQQFHYVATRKDEFTFGLKVAQVIGFTDKKVQVQFQDGTTAERFGIEVAIL